MRLWFTHKLAKLLRGQIGNQIGSFRLYGINAGGEISYEKRTFVPRRALMYVPASEEKKLAKISSLQADCIVLDCEDGVALSKKTEAR